MKQLFTALFTLSAFFATRQVVNAQCSTTPCSVPTVAYDAPSACILPTPDALNCYFGQTINNTPVSLPPYWCTSVENNQWFAFTATGPNVSFDIEALNCSTGGAIQAALLETSNCVDFTFVSDCLGNIPSGSTQTLSNNVPLTPGNVYYLMIDGSAGAQCNYAINGSSAITSGPENVCIPPNGPFNYTTTSPAQWSIVNGSGVGNIVGSNVGTSIDVNFTQPGSVQVCAQNLACPNVPLYCLNVTIGESVEATHTHFLCTGESVSCSGVNFSAPGVYQINVPAPSGCDSLITCNILPIPPINVTLPPVFLCGPVDYQLCNNYYNTSGIYTEVCDSWQGCDSTVSVNLTILEPTAYINPPEPLGCGPDSILFLDGSGSNIAIPPIQGSFLWTGPGIVGANNLILCQVNAPGQYCLRVTHQVTSPTGPFSCFDEYCVTVTEQIIIPQAPNLTGPTNVCNNQSATYTANLQGPVIPDNLTWITPNGEPVTPGPNNTAVVNWTGSQGGQLCVTANNECGSSPPACINVVVSAGPAQPVITGPATVCANSTTQTFTISNFQNNVNYTWTVPPGATFTGSGQSINVNFSGVAPGPVTVCATGSNNCGTSTQGCANVTVTGPPNTPTMSGPANVCANGGAYTYSVTNIQTGVTYTWTAPPGATISNNGTGTSVTIDFTNSNNGQVCVTATNNCGTPSVCQAVTVAPAPTAQISGTGEFCQGTTPSIPITFTASGAAPWTIIYTGPGGNQTINMPASPHTINVSAAGTYTLVSVTGANACSSTNVSGSAVITQNPTPTATLSGGGNICEGSGQTVPLSIVLTGEAPWVVQWFVDGAPQTDLTVNSSPFTLPIGESNPGDITLGDVTDNNGCLGTGSGTATVLVLGAPVVSNILTTCDANNTSYVVTFDITGGDIASYNVTPAGTISPSGQFSSAPIPTGQGYSFVVTDANDCNPVTVADPIVVCNCDTKVGNMDLATIENCGAGTVTANYDPTNQFFDGNDILVFYLHSGNSANVVPPIIATSPTPSVTFDPATMSFGTTYYLSAVVGDPDGTGAINLNDPCAQVAQGTPIVFYEFPTATIDGAAEICIGDQTDLTITLTGASPWEVTINGTPTSIFTSPFQLSVNPNTTTTYDLTSVTDNHCTAAVADAETVTVNIPPTVTNVNTQCDPTGTTFTVSFQINGGDPTCYSVTPNTGSLVGNTFTSTPIASGSGYSFTVTDCKGCTPVLVEDPLVDCDCLSEAGNMTGAPLSVCETDIANGTYSNQGEFLDADDELCFILHAGNPLQPLASNSTPSFSYQAGMNYGQTYFICPVVGNSLPGGCVDLTDNCLSIGGCIEVVFRETPTASLGPDVSICNGDAATLTFNVTGSSPWLVSYTDPAGAPQTMNLNTSPVNFNVSPSATGTYTITGVSDAFCPGTVSGTSTVTVNNPPQVGLPVDSCTADATAYIVTFNVTGGLTGTITVTPATGLFNNGTFVSQPIPNNQPYTFSIDDANACGPVTISGIENCICLTDAGAMASSALEFCVDENATVPATVGSFLDPDDVLVYYLHTGSGPALGTVIATTTVVPPALPSFTFDPATMTLGTTYYISAVAGNNNGSGGVDLTDACLDVNAGTPVVFNALPTANISGTATLCVGQTVPVTFSATGQGPFTVTYSINSGASQTVQIPASGSTTINVSPTATQTITLISVTDANCNNTATASIQLTVNPNVSAGNAISDFEFCQGTDNTISLGTALSGSTGGGTWVAPSGEIVPNGSFNVAGLAAGTHIFTYTVPGLPPCPDDSEDVQVIINPLPTADAGQPFTLNCDDTETTLGGPGNTPGVTYQWSSNVPNPTSPAPVVTEPGTYSVTVTTVPQGCTATAEVVISEDVTPPSADVTVSDVSCFGEQDGFITIDNITGGEPPYLISFNGSPFSEQQTYTNLSPGQQNIIIEDANGCSTALNFNVQEPQQVTVQIEGSFEGNDPLVNLGDPLTLQIITTPPFNDLDSVAWGPAELVDCDTCETNTIIMTQQTTFHVYIEEEGCPAEDDITVFVKKVHPVYIPNAFSPNDDGINDKLIIFGGKEVQSIKSFLIFSRWGETVFEFYNFEPNNPDFGWDGKHRGERMNSAVFTYFAEVEFIDGRIELFEGSVTLTR